MFSVTTVSLVISYELNFCISSFCKKLFTEKILYVTPTGQSWSFWWPYYFIHPLFMSYIYTAMQDRTNFFWYSSYSTLNRPNTVKYNRYWKLQQPFHWWLKIKTHPLNRRISNANKNCLTIPFFLCSPQSNAASQNWHSFIKPGSQSFDECVFAITNF